MDEPLLQLIGVGRTYTSSNESVTVLHDLSFSINAGEFVAIVGASGSGKSTLMNLLGCLDRPTQGRYLIAGQSIESMSADELAELRNRHFGFVFQRYQLLPGLSALQNVEMPAIYGAESRSSRRERAIGLLDAVGLAQRRGHRPNQLSGGQQQRVALARALMNGGRVILADEPTGALDSHSARDAMQLLNRLHARGHTIIVVTHDMTIASHAQRIIELSDGRVVADRFDSEASGSPQAPAPLATQPREPRTRGFGYWIEMLRMAWQEVRVHRLRTGLTILGIAMGVASVLCVEALVEGAQEQILNDLQTTVGTRSIHVVPGNGPGDRRAQSIETLVPADVHALAQQKYVDSVSPEISREVTLHFGSVVVGARLRGVSKDYFRVSPMKMLQGQVFGAADIERSAPEAVIDEMTRKRLLPYEPNPIGQTILIGRLPVRVAAVVAPEDPADPSLNVYLPYSTVMHRIVGKSSLNAVTVGVAKTASVDAAEHAIERLMLQRHGVKDFFTINSDKMRQTVLRSERVFHLLAICIALTSLIVAGIGVMNIMLISVAQRAREIGIRMAVGARRGDISSQFVIEATLLCLLGAAAGVVLSRTTGVLFAEFVTEFRMVFSATAVAMSFVVALGLGMAFGLTPARRAASLDPVEALARE